MSKVPVADQVQVNFRMPADLRDRIKQAADRNNRSMNAEIVATLEEKYPAPVENAFQAVWDAAFNLGMLRAQLQDAKDENDEEILRDVSSDYRAAVEAYRKAANAAEAVLSQDEDAQRP